MRLVTYKSPEGSRLGALRADSTGVDRLVDIGSHDPELPRSLRELLALGDQALERAEVVAREGRAFDGELPPLQAPLLDPQKIICVGLNYFDHATETGAKVGKEPVIFCKFPTALRGPGEPIELPPESDQVDYEAELVVVIGKQARRVSREKAWKCVAGYCCGHDVSARDWQKNKPGGQWLLGKSFDGFAPLGPALVTPDEIPDPGNLPIQLLLNGKVMQDSNTSQLIFPIDMLIAYLSCVCTLLPGDLIFTGTPPGVGMARKPPVFLQPGDRVDVVIEGVGTLSNPVITKS